MSKLLTIIGWMGVGLGLVLSGVLNSGDRIRGNYANESISDKSKRFNVAMILMIIGLISFGLDYFFFGGR